MISKTISKNVGQHTGGKWLIDGNKYCKDNHLQSLELHYDIP